MTKILEIACFNLESAIIAEAAGANRIELCEDYTSGGITPSEDLIIEVRKKIKIPIHVIIRPRPGNFIYSVDEIEQMKKSIEFCKQNGIDGVVFGILNPAKEINVMACAHLIEIAKPMSVNFHRAIDECKYLSTSFQKLIDLGFERVLSSGSAINALIGLEKLTVLQNQFGQKITIIPAGNVRSSNIKKISSSDCTEFHSSAIISKEILANSAEIKAMISNLNTV